MTTDRLLRCVGAIFGATVIVLLGGCAAQPPHITTQPVAQQSVSTADTAATNAAFRRWVDDFRTFAAAQGITTDVLTRALGSATFLPGVIKNDRYQPEFTRAIWDYLDSAVSASRIQNGQAKLQAHRAIAERISRQFGVPAQILVAIWGMESNYGSNTGGYSTIDALATLGFDGRRHDFARRQLLDALRILQSGDVDRQHMTGSWAGALGQPQFLPSSYLEYAVDADGDGQRDIWFSVADVLASIANYLQRNGWQTGQRWGTEVVLPAGFDYAAAGLDEQHSSRQWAARGVRPARGGQLPQFASAAVIVPAGAQGPAFLVGPNFHVILRYNHSTSYALAVAHLADRIAGGTDFVASWPRDEKTLSREQVKQLQRALNTYGFNAGSVDGLLGPSTRSAVRAFQRSVGEPADGFATVELLHRLQQADG